MSIVNDNSIPDQELRRIIAQFSERSFVGSTDNQCPRDCELAIMNNSTIFREGQNGFELSPDWVTDCLRWRGELLIGAYSHWCGEWDDLPVDETCPEFACCTCFTGRLFKIARWWCRRQYEP